MIYFFTIFFTVYALANFYIFLRGWQALSIIPQLRVIYTIIFLIAVSSYIIARLVGKYLPYALYTGLTWIGSFWFMFLLYFLVLFLLFDLFRFADRVFHFLPGGILSNPRTLSYAGIAILFITLTASIYGYFNRSNIKVKQLEINLRNEHRKEYNIVFFSDLHASVINNHSFLKNVVAKINSLAPDLILIGGDLVDESVENLSKYKIVEELKKLKAPLGIYAATGNHEFINGGEPIIEYFEKLGIKFLRDESVLIDSTIYIIGREDISSKNFIQNQRKSLSQLTSTLNRDTPKILLDHQPINLDEAAKNSIDLQLSGHTHNGQIFPLNLITKLVYEVSWGYKRKGTTHFFVSSGIGTWGPPVKIASDAEIVHIKIRI
jgi:predicted MPP superfamily phosphohydrolase